MSLKYWCCALGLMVFYILNKDVITGKKWIEKNYKMQSTPNQHTIIHKTYTAALPPASKAEKAGYLELIQLCASRDIQEKLTGFIYELRDFSKDEEYMSTLNYVIEYLNENNIHLIMSLDWKSDVSDLGWRLSSSLKDNFNKKFTFPLLENYREMSVAHDHVFEDFDKSLRSKSFQMSFIDTKSDEYVIIVHRTEDKEAVEQAVRKIGYEYFEK